MTGIDELTEVYLQDTPIESAGPAGQLGALAPRIELLDLSNTLLPSWDAVAAVAAELPSMVQLRLCKNRLASPVATLTVSPNPMRHLLRLFLNESAPSIEELEAIAPCLPNLEELHLCTNKIVTLAPTGGGGAAAQGGGSDEASADIIDAAAGGAAQPRRPLNLPTSLKLINLEDNLLTSWEDVLTVSHLPHLETLFLSSNQIGAPTAAPEGAFPSLKTLYLGKNMVNAWSGIDALGTLPRLTDLRIRHNPLFNGEQALHSRQLVMSRLGTVVRLNGTTITERERLIAERFYLQKHAQEWWAAKDAGVGGQRVFAKTHPAFARLVGVHSEPDKPVAAVTAIKEGFVSLTAKLLGKEETKTIQLPARTTVARLRQVLKAKKVLAARTQAKAKIMYSDLKEGAVPIELDDDLRDLAHFEVYEGTITISGV